MRVSTLSIRLDFPNANWPKVRLLVDGEERLALRGYSEPNDPADILDTGALLPTDQPRRIAFYGCDCGTFGCANVAGLINRRGERIEWTDFVSVTGVYNGALPDPEDEPDPVSSRTWDDDLPDPERHRLPTFTFDADQYLEVVRRAMADRSWETRPRAVLRHLKDSRPDLTLWAARTTDEITTYQYVADGYVTTDLTVPPGDPERLAASLRALLDDGVRPRQIAAEGLWR